MADIVTQVQPTDDGERKRGARGSRGARGARGGRGDHRGAPRGDYRGAPRGTLRGGTRGGRGFGRGGKKFEDKNNGEEVKGENKRDGKGPREHNGPRDGRRGRAPKDAPKDSYFFKFHFGPWPELEEVEVKIDTEIPESIPKDERLPEPLKEDYIKTMQSLDDGIKSLIDNIKDIRQQKDDVYNKGVEENKSKLAEEGFKEEGKTFKELVSERNAIMDKKKALDVEIKKEKDKFESVQLDIKAIQRHTNPKYKTTKAVEDRIKEVEMTVQTETIGAKQEKEYYTEISFLKKSIKYVERLEKIPDTKEKREATKALEKKAKALRFEVAKINQVLDIKAEENRKRKEISLDKKTDLDLLEEKIKKIREDIKVVEVQKDEGREDYYKRKFEYEIQKAQVMHVDRMNRRKNDLLKYEAEKAIKDEEKKAERDALPNPFEDDISTCDFLLRFCKKIIKDREQKETKVLKDSETKEVLEKRAEEFKKQAQDGKIQVCKPKAEREKEEVLVIGGKPKKTKRTKNQPKPQEVERESKDPNELNFKYEIIQNFGEAGINPPSLFTELEDKIAEIETKRAEFFEKGEKRLDEQYSRSEDKRDGTENPDEEDRKTKTKQANFKLEETDETNWPTMQ